MPFERQESWAVPPRPAHGPLGLLFKKFVAFLWQIAPIVPVLPTPPVYKPFAVNKMRAKRYLDTVEVRSSSLLVPTIFSITYEGAQKLLGSFGVQ
jgi:hypothetical protein